MSILQLFPWPEVLIVGVTSFVVSFWYGYQHPKGH